MSQSPRIAEPLRNRVTRQKWLLPLPVALSLATLPFLAALLIALLWPAMYVARSILVLEPRSPRAREAVLAKGPGEISSRMQRGLVEPSELEACVRKLGIDPSNPVNTDRVREALSVLPEGALSYRVEFRWRDAKQVKEAANHFAHRVVERAARDLEILPELVKGETLLDQRTRELATFLAAHPELALEAPPVGGNGERPSDRSVEVLKRERAFLERSIAEAERRNKNDSDNPYVDPPARVSDLRARLTKVSAALAAHERVVQQAARARPPQPEVLEQWKALVKAVSEARKQPEQTASSGRTSPALDVRIVSTAASPDRPEGPHRAIIVGIGVVVTVGLNAILVVLALLNRASRTPLHSPDYQPQNPGLYPQPSPPGEPGRVAGEPNQGRGGPGDHARSPAASEQQQALPPAPQRASSRPPPGAGTYSLSVHVPDSDPPPPEQLGPVAQAWRARTPPGAIEPTAVRAPAEARIPPNDPQKVPVAATPANRVASEPVRPSNVRPRPAMKRTTTLIYGSMVPPEAFPADENAIVTTGHSVSSSRESDQPIANAEPHFTVMPGVSGWRPNLGAPLFTWIPGLRDELYSAALQRSPGRCFVVMITCAPGTQELKSQVAAQLALSLCEAGDPRILLLEADLDRPSVHRLMAVEMPRFAGFSQQMHARIHGKHADGWTVVECLPKLHVLAEGRMRSPGLLHSFEFESAVAQMRRRYELIVMDAPPVSRTTDMRALEPVADGVIVVEQSGGSGQTAGVDSELFGRKLLRSVYADAAHTARL